VSVDDIVPILSSGLPSVVRWAGAIARQLRYHDIALTGKTSGFADTDALTLADLALQELLVAALRDMGPAIRRCRIEAEETTGDLGRFAKDGDWVLAIDPIDGTRVYRDRTGSGYSVMLHARTAETVRYSLLYFPEEGADGTWLEARDGRIVLGPDDPGRAARGVLDALSPISTDRRTESRKVWVGGFLGRDAERARAVTATGLQGIVQTEIRLSPYTMMAQGDLGGALVHTPNIYDFPVCIHIARLFGGDAVWVADGRPVDFRSLWRDERSSMLRLPGIVACAFDRTMLGTLIGVARDWSRERYDS
jgi:3'(2'), 5'-bisphosphate nucleotidase